MIAESRSASPNVTTTASASAIPIRTECPLRARHPRTSRPRQVPPAHTTPKVSGAASGSDPRELAWWRASFSARRLLERSTPNEVVPQFVGIREDNPMEAQRSRGGDVLNDIVDEHGLLGR